MAQGETNLVRVLIKQRTTKLKISTYNKIGLLVSRHVSIDSFFFLPTDLLSISLTVTCRVVIGVSPLVIALNHRIAAPPLHREFRLLFDAAAAAAAFPPDLFFRAVCPSVRLRV
jgi:hypothetical protein